MCCIVPCAGILVDATYLRLVITRYSAGSVDLEMCVFVNQHLLCLLVHCGHLCVGLCWVLRICFGARVHKLVQREAF
jgi:hypothetical protein